ncbi:hypothetical protein ACFYTQ_33525 [Nocardia sp. NPDC004068]|uniref:hypothetical protein n=1 Tax=Nocardia sp. NPDC004068 TaxID=3364303 RepID=UPI0036ADAF3A
MKVPNERDFLVYASPMQRAYAVDNPSFLRTAYVLGLNDRIEIGFVPDVSDIVPPWPAHEDSDFPQSEREARVWALRVSDYSVTPNSRFAGTSEKIALLPRQSAEPRDEAEFGVVWFVGTSEWEGIAAELGDLCGRTSPFGDFIRFSKLAGTHLHRFLEERFLSSSLLASETVDVLRRAR